MDLFANLLEQSGEIRLPRGRRLPLGPRPLIMGILNVTPDSFSDGGRFASSPSAVEEALRMVEEGADIIDVGGESTRPGAQAIPADEQCRRTLGVIEGIRKRSDVAISIDTRDPTVGQRALKAGADIVNDVSACAHPGWVPVLLDRPDVPVVLMHMRGTPETMQTMTSYPDGVLAEIRRFFESRLDELEAAGIGRDRVILDPGIGFAKEAAQNLEVLGGLEELRSLGRPILVGASRKVFLGHLLERATSSSPGARRGALEGSAVTRIPAERDVATVVVHAIAALAGAAILRVHNVGYARDLAHVLEGFARFGTAHERREER